MAIRRLFIAEKPSLGEAIAAGLGGGQRVEGMIRCGEDVVTWCFGHILQHFEPEDYDEKYKKWRLEDLPLVPEQWRLKVTPDKAKQLKLIKQLVADAEVLVNAGDPDREGQLLVDEVLSYIGALGKKPTQRILVNALDEKSVKQALNDLRDNREFVGLRNSALARSRADWIIGMNLTRACTIKGRQAGFSSVVSVGRVQTPTLALVVRREDEIKNFKSVEHYLVRVAWQHENGILPTVWKPMEGLPGLDAEGRLVDRSVAEELAKMLKGKNCTVTKMEQKNGELPPRLPYSLSALQIDAGRKFGYSPQEVLDTQQELYEKKLTTYPRSDCDYLPENQLMEAGQVLDNLAGLSTKLDICLEGANRSLRSRAWNDKKISAHHAIIPTTVRADLAAMTEKQKNLYTLVAKAYIAQFYEPQKYLASSVEVEAVGETFTASGKVILKDGWKAIYKDEPEADGEKSVKADITDENTKIPLIKEGDQAQYLMCNIAAKKTQPPKRYTTATLLEAMKKIGRYVKDKTLQPLLKECSGIGTEATRANIIETIQKRGYVETKKKCLVPTEAAYMMMDILPDSITYPDVTAQWEKNLDAICQRQMKLQEFFEQQEVFVQRLLSEALAAKIEPPANLPCCPKCQQPLRRIQSKKNKKFYWVCPHRECEVIFGDKRGKPDTSPKPKYTKSAGAGAKSGKRVAG